MSLHRWTGLFIVGFSSVTQNGAVLAELRIGGVVIARNNQTVHNNLTSNGDDIVREEIFYGMTDTNERFEFTNLDHAGAHCSVRMAIIDAINGMKAGEIGRAHV